MEQTNRCEMRDDSPVESVRRDVFVDELPFSSKVHRAVQLWGKKVGPVSKMNACFRAGLASN